MTGAQALHLLIERDRCIGLRLKRGAKAMAVAADQIILAAGAIGTPKLLLLSGIGPEHALSPHGITLRHPLAGVGRNLSLHVNVKLSAFVDRPTYNTQRRGVAAVRHGLRFLIDRSGPVTSPANHGQAFVRTDPSLASADVQIQLMPLGFGSGDQMRQDGVTAVVSPCRPEARGQVRLRSGNPLDAPRITLSLLDSAHDVATLLRGCRLAWAALEGGPGRRMRGRLYAPPAGTHRDADWRDFFKQSAALNWHPCGTCRMGPGSDAVVDSSFRVHGLQGLRIVDASVMPHPDQRQYKRTGNRPGGTGGRADRRPLLTIRGLRPRPRQKIWRRERGASPNDIESGPAGNGRAATAPARPCPTA
jgi:choline dehydrogenase